MLEAAIAIAIFLSLVFLDNKSNKKEDFKEHMEMRKDSINNVKSHECIR